MPSITNNPTLNDIKAQLNIDHSEDDALLQGKLDAAMAWCAAYVGPFHNPNSHIFDEAVLQLAAAWYEQREAVVYGDTGRSVPFGVIDLLNVIRGWSC